MSSTKKSYTIIRMETIKHDPLTITNILFARIFMYYTQITGIFKDIFISWEDSLSN